MLPALLSFLGVSSAAAAGAAVSKLIPWFFLGSLGFLGYAHYLVWFRRMGHTATKIILVANTLLVAYLWSDRVKLWLERLCG